MNKRKKGIPFNECYIARDEVTGYFDLIKMNGFKRTIRDQVGHGPNHTGYSRGNLEIKGAG